MINVYICTINIFVLGAANIKINFLMVLLFILNLAFGIKIYGNQTQLGY